MPRVCYNLIMFKKLKRKIYAPLFLLAIALIVFINVFAAVVQIYTLKDTYRVMGEQKLTRIINSYRLYINSAKTSAYNLSLDETVIEELYSEGGNSLTAKLNATCNYSLKINAVCAYSAVSGAVYTSSQVTNVPDLEELKQDENIAAFIDGDEADYVSMRTKYIADIYNNTLYPEEMGVFTCCQKVYKDGQTVGWIFTDILPANLYSYVYTENQSQDTVAFIICGDEFFSYEGNGEKAYLLDGDDGDYFKYSSSVEGLDFTVTIFEGKSDYVFTIVTLAAILGGVSVALIVAVHFIALATANYVTDRLDNILDKMDNAVIP